MNNNISNETNNSKYNKAKLKNKQTRFYIKHKYIKNFSNNIKINI